MTIKQAQSRILKLRKEITAEKKLAVKRTLAKAKTEAKRMSSGPLTPKDLRKRDHPYATRHGILGNVAKMPGKSRAKINVGTGDFREHWGTDNPQAGDSIVSGRLYNLSPIADYLIHGTSKMTRRPIDDHMFNFVEVTALEEIGVAQSRLERIYG